MQRSNGSLINLGASHHTAPIDVRERFSIGSEKMAELYRHLLAVPGVKEAAILSTCNRTEVYAVLNGDSDPVRVSESFCTLQALDRGELDRYGFEWRDQHAVRHLFSVASGLDSLVVGEAEILGQVKSAYGLASQHQALGPLLNRLFQKTFQAAKWVRTHTSIGRGQVSVGSVAVDLALKIFGNLENCRILVVGAGEISEKTITALKSRGATRLTVCNRTDQKAMDLAKLYGGSAIPYVQFASSVADFDIVLCSTSSPTPIVTKAMLASAMKKRSYEPLFLIDLALPRDVEAKVSELENIYLYNIDDLSQIAEENLALRRAEMERCQEILARRAEEFWKNAAGR
jgi:glutamyl-tRNA reductase